MTIPYLSVHNLGVRIGGKAADAFAVRNISFSISSGEILALVGESGCGKSVTSLAIMGLLATPPMQVVEGVISVDGEPLLGLPKRRMEDIRGARIGMIFQEPMSSLNPVLSIKRQMIEGLVRHRQCGKREAEAQAISALASVGIADPDRVMRQYPHQLSGGMRQRVMIASVLSLKPGLVIADEPTTALDVTVQSQVLELIVGLRNNSGAGILLITHDLGVVAEVADRVAVMYAGRIVELSDVDTVLSRPRHPYTKALLASRVELPSVFNGQRPPALPTIPGSVPPVHDRPAGCSFRERCAQAVEKCRAAQPPLTAVSAMHEVACWRA